MYKNNVLCDSENYEIAYANIVDIEANVCDKAAYMERKGWLELQLGTIPEANTTYQALVERNPENQTYLEGYLKCFERMIYLFYRIIC